MPSNEEARRHAALGDLRACLDYATELGNVEVIQGADPDLEIGTLYELSLEEEFPPVLLFENIKGYPPGHRVVVNVRSSKVFDTGAQGLDLVRSYRRKNRKQPEPIPPVNVQSGPVLENIQEGDQIDITSFPAPRWHQGDGGRYIGTECLVITKDPDSDWTNIGTYRVMVHDKKTLVVFIEPGKHGDLIRRKYWERGQACPMVVCVGQAPVLGATAASTPGPGTSEYAVAGSRLGEAISVVTGRHTSISIPADAELAFEGFMPAPADVSAPEGPFGEWPGYYASNSRPEPVLQVMAVYHRDNPIIVGAPPMKPTLPGFWFGTGGSSHFRAAAMWDELEAAGISGICGVWKMPGGGPRFINVVSIKQAHSGHAKMAGLVALGCGSNAYLGRIVIIVDDDIDITKPAEVMWALATRWDPKTQTDIIDGCWTGYIDPMLSPTKRNTGDMTNSRIVIYAVRPYHWGSDYPAVNAVSKDYAAQIRDKWRNKLKFLNRGVLSQL